MSHIIQDYFRHMPYEGYFGVSQESKFAKNGVVTIRTPFTTSEIEALSELCDRLTPFKGYKQDSSGNLAHVGMPDTTFAQHGARVNHIGTIDEALIPILENPFLEHIAKLTLNASKGVLLFQTQLLTSYKHQKTSPYHDRHADMAATISDMNATPRRMSVFFILWLTDVSFEQAPLIVYPGSHRILGSLLERYDANVKAMLPYFEHDFSYGLFDFANIKKDVGFTLKRQWVHAEPGALAILNPVLTHGISRNLTDTPRKMLLMKFMPENFERTIKMPQWIYRGFRRYNDELRNLLSPNRTAIVHPARYTPGDHYESVVNFQEGLELVK